MYTEIYYFSGTGNSLHVADELVKKIPNSKKIPITSMLRKDSITAPEKIGLVFPIHVTMAPSPVIEFLKKLNLRSTNYIFAVATRASSQHRAFKDLQKILKTKNRLNSTFTLNMGSNDPKFEGWEPPTSEMLDAINIEINTAIDFIAKTVMKNENSLEIDNNYTERVPFFSLLSIFMPILLNLFNEDFYSNGNCTGCGTCSKVCLSNKIRLVEGKSEWMENVKCFYCHACINYCPENAVQIKSTRFLKSYTDKNGRYSHPYADVEDIARQKNWKMLD